MSISEQIALFSSTSVVLGGGGGVPHSNLCENSSDLPGSGSHADCVMAGGWWPGCVPGLSLADICYSCPLGINFVSVKQDFCYSLLPS